MATWARSALAGRIEHTLLKPEATAKDVDHLCREARTHGLYGVCVNPVWVGRARQTLAGSPVKLVSVVGFPLGASTTLAKARETAEAVASGADEIDMVLAVGLLRSGEVASVRDDIRAVVEAAGGRPVKVILETALLTDEQKIEACGLVQQAGAAFVKTSTGFGPGGATEADVRLLRRTIGPAMGLKASGGIKTYAQAVAMLQAGATRLGCSASLAILAEAPTEPAGASEAGGERGVARAPVEAPVVPASSSA